MHKAYRLPIVFFCVMIGYFAPFFFPVQGGGLFGLIFAGILLVWIVLFLTVWLYVTVRLFLLARRDELSREHIHSAIAVALIYGIWFILTNMGYFHTA